MNPAEASLPKSAMAVMAHCRTGGEDANFFPTPVWAARAIGHRILQLDPEARTCWEPACGAGHMALGLQDAFDTVYQSDLCLYGDHVLHDFIGEAPSPFRADWIVTNPPFGDNIEPFIRRAYAEARRGVALLMRAGVMEGQGRYGLIYQDCPLTLWCPFAERVPMHRGRWEADGSSAAFYALYVWIKPVARARQMMVSVNDGWWPGVLPFAPGQEARWHRDSDLALAVGGGR